MEFLAKKRQLRDSPEQRISLWLSALGKSRVYFGESAEELRAPIMESRRGREDQKWSGPEVRWEWEKGRASERLNIDGRRGTGHFVFGETLSLGREWWEMQNNNGNKRVTGSWWREKSKYSTEKKWWIMYAWVWQRVMEEEHLLYSYGPHDTLPYPCMGVNTAQ